MSDYSYRQAILDFETWNKRVLSILSRMFSGRLVAHRPAGSRKRFINHTTWTEIVNPKPRVSSRGARRRSLKAAYREGGAE